MHVCKIWHALQTLFEGFNPKVRARSDPQHFRALFFLRAARRTRRHSGVCEGGVARRTARPWRRARAGRGRTDPGREGGACGERRRRRTTRRRRAPCAAHSGWQKRGEADFLVRLPRVGVFSRVPACGGADTRGRLGQKDRLGSLGRARNGGLARVCRAHWLERR